MKCAKIPKEKITRMEGHVGRRNHDVMMMVPKFDMIPLKNNQFTKMVDFIIIGIFKEIILNSTT